MDSKSSLSLSEQPLHGKLALVTGASRGIGLAIAHRLATLGATLAISSRDPQKLASAGKELEAAGAKVTPVAADLAKPAEIDVLLRKVERLGPIEILVNNAGVGFFGPVQEASEENWDAVLDTNLKAVFLLSKAVAPGMIQRKSGHIINIASLAGKNAFAGGSIYCASKWGLLGLTACMAEDLRAHGIRVSAVCPGSVATDFTPHTGKDQSKILQPQDVAHAVAMIVTQEPQSFISEILLRPTQKP
jgi:NAD(P)-dependent dehydrogenase (short-subunit alcohol dehydrogenase family)